VTFVAMKHIRFYKTGFEIVHIYCAQTCSILIHEGIVLRLSVLVKRVMIYKTDTYVRSAYYRTKYLMEIMFYIF
jgi:hypothetical protein